MKKSNEKNRLKFKVLTKNSLVLELSCLYFLFLFVTQINALNCPSGFWPCNNGIQCINSTLKCNNIIDCEDGSDEGTFCNTTCTIGEFKCQTGNECIRMELVCDHDKDCTDGSDEHSNCSYPICGFGRFTCANKRCISDKFVCDGDNDCLDNSDEKFCATKHCPPNQLACNTTGKCIDIQKYCNGISDCPDGSDEGQTCSSSRCTSLSCTYACRPTPRGGICYCPQGQMINPANNRTCIDVDECEMWDECDQLCINRNNSYSCQCKTNYTLQPNGHCKHQTSDTAKIIFSIGSKIFETDQNAQNFRTILNNNDVDISSFDYNYEKNLFYLADDKNNNIYKATLSSLGQFEITTLIFENILGPFQISVDWITNNIYVLQKSLSRIDVYTSDGKNTTNLVSNLLYPTSIALDPTEGLLFVTDSGVYYDKNKGARIEKLLMDGRNRQIIVQDKLLEPIAITVDLIKKRLFWIDRKYDHLETSDYNGLKRFIIASGSQNLPHSVSIDIFESTIFFADYTKLAIMKLTRHAITTDSNVTYHYKTSEKPHFVKVYHETKQIKISNPCENNSTNKCQHFCLLSHSLNSVNSFRCKCNTGYQLRNDLKTCERITSSLYASQGSYLRSLSLVSESTEARHPLIMPHNGHIRIFDTDFKNNKTFFYNTYRRAIYESNDLNEIKILIPDNLWNVENMAYDWVSNNLYYINNDELITVKINEPKKRRVILRKSQLKGLAIDPNSGFIFYSSTIRPAKIFRAFLDGLNETLIIQRGLSLPFSLALDLEQKRLYWSDSHMSKIQYSDYNGNNVQTILQSALYVPFSIQIYKYNLYFVDLRHSNIYRMSKLFSATPYLFRSNLKDLFQIRIQANDSQKILDNHPCMRQNGDCSDFCFSVPSIDPQYKLSRHCGCPFGFKLDSNNLNCVVNPLEKDDSLNMCQAPYFFKCSNDRCIPRSNLCDGINDCLDMSDELNCPVIYCTNEQFKCRNGTCIDLRKKCDGVLDCDDFSDEMNCPFVNCDSKYYFKCNNGSCIPLSWKCDSDNDCGDASDEANCSAGQCDPITQFECHGQNGRCIEKLLVCNGRNDCSNNYDEENCPEVQCQPGQFKCQLDNICINVTKKCDGLYDCPSRTDEQDCRFNPIRTTCHEDEYSCGTSGSTFTRRATCIPKYWVCDGHVDCDNGQDEASCPTIECPQDYFKCNNSKCIPNSWRCDNEDDCGDNTDEKNCPGKSTQCRPDQFKCAGSMDVCVNYTQLCDNVVQCPDGSDEGAFCGRDDCSIQNGGCSHFCHQAPIGSMCFCPLGYQTTNSSNYKRCEDINECEFETACNQRCSNYRGGYYCACETGYYTTDSRSCKAATRNYAKVYATNGQNIIISNLEGTVLRTIRKPRLMRSITAFDFQNRTGRIFWADKITKSIYSSYENGTNVIRLVSSGTTLVEAIAVDWIGSNIYWADYGLQQIEVAKLDGSRRRIFFNANVTNPRGLVLDPRLKHRYIFWSDWGKNPRIERANLDGSNRTVIISSKLYWPNGLAIDLIRERLYFADAHLDYIESCDYYGNKRVQIISNDLSLHHPHSLSFFEHHIFWVDRGHSQLIKLDRFNPKNKTILSQVSSQALTVKVVHEFLQPNEDNPCSRSNCEHICLLSKNQQGFSCECQIGYVKDSRNPNRCNIDESEFLIILNKNIIGGLRISLNDTIQPETSSLVSTFDDDADSDISVLEKDLSFLWDRMVTINDINQGYDFTYSYKDQLIYWLEHDWLKSSVEINKIKFDGEDRGVLSMDKNELFGYPYCLELDPVSRNIFVGNIQESKIEAVNVDNFHKTVIFTGSQNELGVGEPISITLNSMDSEIYWIDNGFDSVPRKIGAVKMDGSSSRIILKQDLINPLVLIYHQNGRRIYWSDSGRKKIESISISNSEDRQIVVNYVDHVSALAIWDTKNTDGNRIEILYYSDQIQEVLVAFNLKTSEKQILKSNVPDIYRLKIYQKNDDISNVCSLNNGNCHQICLPSVNNRICKCSNGLQLQTMDGSCRPFEQFILYATKYYIKAIPLDGNDQIEALPIIQGNNIKKFDFDYRTKSIFWIEDDNLVKSLTLNFSWTSSLRGNESFNFINEKVLFELDSSSGKLQSLSYDWINNLLYYSYLDSPYSYIKVTRYPQLDYHLTIFQSKEDKPSLLAVNPRLKYLYWIDQGQNSKLERSNLDGTNRTILINSDILTPSDIFIDQETGDVYWSDNTRDKIEKCDWNGQNRKVVKADQLPNPQSIFINDKNLYYADSRLRGVYSLNLSYSNNSVKLLKKVSSYDLTEILVFSDKTQPLNIPTSCSLNTCDQFCFNLHATTKCACGLGELDSNGKNCKLPKEYIIFAMEDEIRSLNIPVGNLVGGSPWRAITGLNRAIGIDFDYRDNFILFTDIRDGKIKSFQPDNPVIKDLLVNENMTRLISRPEGIAYDWVSDTIFYADNQLNQIRSYKISTRQSLIISYSDSPRAIVVHPCKGYLFWTDVGRSPMIARSSMTGSNFEKIITSDIKWPNGLSIDFDEDRLYWADAYYDKIETSDLDGNYRRVLTTAFHPFALVVHGHYIYWTDWSTNSVYRAEKYHGSNTLILVQGLPKQPMDIQVWSEQRQKCTFNPCSIFNGGCSHICSVAPGNLTECRCPFGFNLRLTNNDRTCSLPAMPRCNSTQFTCSNGACISKKFVCDGQRHCSDGSDESINFCAYHTCQQSEFKCRNGRCIPAPERCDRINQCGDNSDELNCVYPTCNAQTEFQCRNFKCIPLGARCNGIIDCDDGNSTDEIGCPPINCTSPVYSVKCPNTNICIMRNWLCDGDNDCGDSADENRLFCDSVPCESNKFRCKDNKCIPYTWVCDGDRDCPDGEDEPTIECRHGNVTCPADMFRCDSGRCINKNFVCDGDRDCPDGSDEDESRHNCADRPCRQDEFRCASGVRGRPNTKCVKISSVCDGYSNCINSEDELMSNCTRRPCRASEFQCANGLCINARYKCDHDDDCGDGSDEPHNCTYAECTSSQFKCDNLRCIPQNQKCNGRNDCLDNSDEKQELCQQNNTCPLGQFQCNNKKCISDNLLCNQQNDCGDNSDENGCGVNECASPLLNRCQHICRDTLTSYKCECKPGFKLVDKYYCIDINECIETPYVCTQLCENTLGSYNCKCAQGYEKSQNDPRSCKITGEQIEPDLLFSNSYYLRNISLNTLSYNLIKEGFHSARGIAYDYNKSQLFVIDSDNRQLLRLNLNTSLTNSFISQDVLINDLDGSERDVAYDWINKKIYYISADRLVVTDWNGHYKTLLLDDKYLKEASSIVLDPLEGYLFISDWSYPPFIARAKLNGQNFTKIITEDLGSPVSLTLDLITKRLFWTDTHLRRIEFSNYNGRNRMISIQTNQTAYPFALSFFSGLIYWTDRSEHSIFSADALSGRNKKTIRDGTVHSVFDLNIFHYSLQPSGINPCGMNNGGCSHLCLIGGDLDKNYTCVCPYSFLLNDDGKTCRANCSDWHFRCGMPDEKCIPYFYKCDGEVDCRDGSDELNCPRRTCQPGTFQCNNSHCVQFTQVCNGLDDCMDGSDEKNCPEGCAPGRFQCPNKKCIPNFELCDGKNDCGDSLASDEINCSNFTCPANKFKCNSGHCIEGSYYCDEDFDCADHSDEPAFTCRNRPCPSGWYRCGNNSYKCIPNRKLCDGQRNCPAGDDENPDKCPVCHPTGDFKCSNNKCIMLSLRCNSVDDCGDNSDESPELCNSLPRRECTESEFKCANGRCIRGSWRCDHENDCGDNSDELNCASRQCHADQWQCKSGHCIPANQHCNGVRNCLDFSDETSCPPKYPDGRYCNDFQFTCNNTFCIKSQYMCDGDNDCGDSSDELLSLCSSYNCSKENERFRCKNGLCIYADNVCNGYNDCADGSDEDFSINGPCKQEHVTCEENEFKCALTHLCIPMDYVCDQDLDCGLNDESDEIGCYNNKTISTEIQMSCSAGGSITCEHNCTDFDHLNGFFCSCHHGFQMVKADTNHSDSQSIRRHTCEDINECESIHLNQCSQKCVNTKGSYECKCVDNYIDSHRDGSICEASWKEDLILLIAYDSEIRQLRPNISDYVYTTLLEDQNNVNSIDIDPFERILYWVDQNTLKRSYIPNSKHSVGHEQILGNFQNYDILTITFDWLNKNIYFYDSKSKSIKVIKSDGIYVKTLINEKCDSVNSLIVNPFIGRLFWINSDPGHAIMTSSMNGQDIRVLIGDHLDTPYGLAIDYFTDRLYWSDSKRNYIESVKFDGSDRNFVIHNSLRNPYKIDIFENRIYWLAKELGSVSRVDKHGRGAVNKLVEGLDLVDDIKVFHSFKLPKQPLNPCANSPCSHLCLIKSDTEYECTCPDDSAFLEGDLSTCDAPLEEALELPLSCKCINCWCWYNDHGVHYKCQPGWEGDLCEINTEAASKAFVQKVKTASIISIPVLTLIILVIGILGFILYKRQNNEDVLSCVKSSDVTMDDPSSSSNVKSGNTSFSVNLQNSEISATEISQPESSSKLSIGYINPIFSKRSSLNDETSEISLNEINNVENNSRVLDQSLNIDSIFSSTTEKSKKPKNSKSKKEAIQFDPSSKETSNDKASLVELSKEHN